MSDEREDQWERFAREYATLTSDQQWQRRAAITPEQRDYLDATLKRLGLEGRRTSKPKLGFLVLGVIIILVLAEWRACASFGVS